MLKDQLQEVEKRIQAACDRAGRKREGFTRGRSCWVTRGHSAEGCKRFEWIKPVRKGY